MKALTLGLGAAALAFAGSAAAAPILEQEPNDSLGSAQVIDDANFDPTGAFSVLGFLGQNDVDYYAVDMEPGYLYTVSVFDFTPGDDLDNDSLLGVFDPGGAEFLVDDDGGPGFLSSTSFTVDSAGAYTIAVSGFGDDDFDGSHDEAFQYVLVVSETLIPAPGALALLGLAGLAGTRRRRRG